MLKYLIQVLSLVLTISLLLLNIFFTRKMDFSLPLIYITILTIITFLLNGYRRVDKRDLGLKIFSIISITFFFQSIMFLIGIKTGYSINLSYIPKGYVLFQNVLYIFAALFVREIFRYLLVNVKTVKKNQYYILQALGVLVCIAIDLYVATKRYTFSSFTLFYEFIALFLVPSASKNIFLTYLSRKCGYITTYIYIIIMDLNIYLVPSSSNINMLVDSVIHLVLPYLLYSYMKNLEVKREEKIEKKKKNKVVSFISTVIFVILVGLVSREFKYSMIGIGSESMTGTINKGDAIIYRRYEPNENVKDKIIVFNKEGRLIVHRAIKGYILDGDMVYQTKGDFNDSQDNWIVTTEELVGVVEYKIPFIAWPSVILGEIF